jgi:Zn-dependent metalloprotease
MRKHFYLFAILFPLNLLGGQSTVLVGEKAMRVLHEAEELRLKDNQVLPSYVKFRPSAAPGTETLISYIKDHFRLDQAFDFSLQQTHTDDLGVLHQRFVQTYNGIKLNYSTLYVHSKEGKVLSYNGVYFNSLPLETISIQEKEALALCLKEMNANTYSWQAGGGSHLTAEEQSLPEAEFVYLPLSTINRGEEIVPCYTFNIYALEPLERTRYFVNASNGEIVFSESQIHTGNSRGVAVTAFSDTQNIITDSVGSFFRLIDATRGNGVETYNCNTTKNYSTATDFTDNDNFWDNFNANLDEYATDAHWGAEMFYDYLLQNFNRNSINNNGFALKSYVHYDKNYVNAFWDGQRMTYGDGDANDLPFTTVDIVGHEIGHGLTDFTADLIYENESGALNESFSDIFGNALENFINPGTINWRVGEDRGAIRNMANPNEYGDPDTYDGLFWIDQNCIPSRNNDHCGVHTNSGVQNYWFYLLVNGGSGINDAADTFSVNSIGIQKAEQIAYRNLSVYLSPSSNFDDARFFSILSAIDLYGACSPEVASVTNAWYAVGVGKEYQSGVSASFTARIDTSFCFAPVTVEFIPTGSNVRSFNWDFGNGMFSTSRNPSTTYSGFGAYDVTLIADGGTCGIDTIDKPAYIKLDQNIACAYFLRDTTNPVVSDCKGRLYDSGALSGDYQLDERGVFTISVPGADYIELTFNSLNIEEGLGGYCNRDYLEVFDGASVSDRLIGRFCKNYPPPGNLIVSGSNSITLRLHSDDLSSDDGFLISWECKNATQKPQVDFAVNADSTCTGIVAFKNLSSLGANAFRWDFGDGFSSTEKAPTHEYKTNGTYDVKLVAQNSFGADSLIKSALITVDRISAPQVSNDTFCFRSNAGLKINTSENVLWYRDTTAASIYAGDSLTIFNFRKDTTLYIREVSKEARVTGGALSNGIGAGEYSGDNDYLLFDVHEEIVLQSIVLFSNKAGIRKLDLRNKDGELVASKDIYVPGSPLQVNINMTIYPDTNYRLSFSDRDVSLYKNTSGATYPYQIGNLVTIKGSNLSGGYPYFYRWSVASTSCVSNFQAIKATVDSSCVITTLTDLEEKASSWIVYPNPTEENFLLELRDWKGQSNLSYQLRDQLGKLIMEDRIVPRSGQKFTIRLEDFPNGIYYFSLQTAKGVETRKVLKIK